MSWLYSRALVAEYLAGSLSDGAPFAPLSESHTPQAFLSQDRMTAFSRPSRFGMTFAPLTDDHGAALLTWYLEDSRARTSALLEREQESPESIADCGRSLSASFAKWHQESFLWRTVLPLLPEAWEPYSETWPRWGLMRDGECWELPPLAHHTSECASGLWQTPVADDPVERETGKWNSRGEPKLSAQVLLPTPTAKNANQGAKSTNNNGKPLLPMAVQMLPTPTARDWKSGKASEETHAKNSRPLSEQIGGSLNPPWVEWLMGWPLGWTDLKPLAMDRFHSAPPKRGAA